MASTAPINIGTKIVVGLPTGQTITGIIRDTVDITPSGDIEWVRDENNADCAAIVSNPGERLVIVGTMKDDITSTVKTGTVIKIAGKDYVVESVTYSRTKTVARYNMTVYAPDGLALGVQPAMAPLSGGIDPAKAEIPKVVAGGTAVAPKDETQVTGFPQEVPPPQA